MLIFNNLMVVGVTRIPWFSYGPFHAAIGISTTRMLINVRKATATVEHRNSRNSKPMATFSVSNSQSDAAGIGTWHAAVGTGTMASERTYV